MKKRRKSKGFFKIAQENAIGLAGLGLTTGITSGIIAQSPSGVNLTPLSSGLNVAAGFSPILSTATLGRSVISSVKKLNKKQNRRKKNGIF